LTAARSGRGHGWARVVLLVLGLALAWPVFAARVVVVLSSDAASSREVFQAVRIALGDSGHELRLLHADALPAGVPADAHLLVAVGTLAAEAVAALPGDTPVLAVLVPRAWYIQSGQARLADGRRPVSALFLDQPFERQARLIRLAFPDARRVGVLLGADQQRLVDDLAAALRSQRLQLVHAQLTLGERLVSPLERVLAESDLLLAVPDPQVFNPATAQSLFLTSYRYRNPVVGYSRSLTRAGALLSLHSSPAQIGRQTAEWLLAALSGPTVRLPEAGYPAYFSVSVNEQVARSLGFALPPASELEKRMGGEG